MHLEHCSSGGASALPHAALPHASAAPPAAGVAAAAAFLDIASQALCAASQFPLQPPVASAVGVGGRMWGRSERAVAG